jgi:hypothetical protein
MTVDKARRMQMIARWHRRFAVFIAIWILVLAVSGVLINHANDWGLDSTPLPGFLQSSIYGIETDSEAQCAEKEFEGVDCSAVFARLKLAAGEVLLSEYDLYLLDGAGRLVEKLTASHLGLDTLDAGLHHDARIYLRDSRTTVSTDLELLENEVLEPEARAALSGHDWLVRGERNSTITWERLLLDLHAARFLGPLATTFSDLMAVLILILAVSGSWLYRLRRNANGNGLSGRGSQE